MIAQMTPLRRRMIDAMTLRDLSPATQQSYIDAIAKFIRFFGRSADELGALVKFGWFWSHIKQATCLTASSRTNAQIASPPHAIATHYKKNALGLACIGRLASVQIIA